jgi:hypothetical protein
MQTHTAPVLHGAELSAAVDDLVARHDRRLVEEIIRPLLEELRELERELHAEFVASRAADPSHESLEWFVGNAARIVKARLLFTRLIDDPSARAAS